MLRNTLRLNIWYLKIIHILHPRYHAKIIQHSKKQVYLFSQDYMINHNENEDKNEK